MQCTKLVLFWVQLGLHFGNALRMIPDASCAIFVQCMNDMPWTHGIFIRWGKQVRSQGSLLSGKITSFKRRSTGPSSSTHISTAGSRILALLVGSSIDFGKRKLWTNSLQFYKEEG